MNDKKNYKLVPYHMVSPGFEAVYTGRKTSENDEKLVDVIVTRTSDDEGNEIRRWTTWGMTMPGDEANWGEDIKLINRMQEKLGILDDKIRQIRAHIGSLVLCDNGVPLTIDEILDSIGRGELREPSFHNGCWMCAQWWESKTTQPFQHESIQGIELILNHYLAGKASDELIGKYPYAKGFVRHVYEWIGPVEKLTELQKLMLKRFFLPFDYLTGRTEDFMPVHNNCYEKGGEGEAIDREISKIADLPEIFANYKDEYKKNLETITDPLKKELYKICGSMVHGLHGLSDCHHSTFRWLERWIHAIGTGKWEIPSRNEESERKRLGSLLFGYSLALNKWLLDIPMQCTLIDLGHMGLDVDPKNEILRVYAYLGDRTPIKEWLAACMWYKVTFEPPASLYKWGWAYKDLTEHITQKGINLREWIDKVMV
jgi:hypothetical protein